MAGHHLGFPEPLIRQLQLNGQPLIRRRERQAHALFELFDRVKRIVRERGRCRKCAAPGGECGGRGHGEGNAEAPIGLNPGNPQHAALRQDGLEV